MVNSEWGRGEGGSGFDAAEDHFAGGGLEGVGDDEFDFLIDFVAGAFNDDHGAVLEVTDALGGAFAVFDDADFHGFAGKGDGLERFGDGVDVDDADAAEAGDFVEVVVVGDDATALLLGEEDELLIDAFGFRDVGEGAIPEAEFKFGHGFELFEDIQATAATGAFEAVAGVGDGLKFVEDKTWDDDWAFEDAGDGHLGDAAVDDDGGVEDHGARAFGGAGELDVRDDEAKIVLGLQDEGDADVAGHEGEQELGAFDQGGVGLLGGGIHEDVGGLLDEVADAEGDDHADDSAEEKSGEGAEVFFADEDIRGDENKGEHDAADHDGVGDGGIGFEGALGGGEGGPEVDGGDGGDEDEKNGANKVNHDGPFCIGEV
jgi:hypothetical protein